MGEQDQVLIVVGRNSGMRQEEQVGVREAKSSALDADSFRDAPALVADGFATTAGPEPYAGVVNLAKAVERTALSRSASPIAAADLASLRGNIFRAVQSGETLRLRELLPRYGVMLETLLSEFPGDASALMRIESDHAQFFEQLKASLVTNRIRVRLELERVRASGKYGTRVEIDSTLGWQG